MAVFYVNKGGDSLERDCKIVGNRLMIPMPQEVDHYQAARLRENVDRLLENRQVRHVVFDFSGTTFMDSSGIGMIMGRYRKIIARGGDVRAIHVNERINRILRLSGIYKLIDIKKGDYYGEYQ